MKQNSITKKYVQFNDFLSGELKRRKISQEEAAYYLKLSQASISMKLAGKVEWTVREIMNLYELMGIEHDFTEEKEARPK